MFFNFDHLNNLLKITEGRDRKLNFAIVLIWSVLIASGWVVVT